MTYELKKGLRSRAIFHKLNGMRKSKIRFALGLSEENYRDLFKPEAKGRLVQVVYPKEKKVRPARLVGPMQLLKGRIGSFQRKGGGAKFTVEDVLARFGSKPRCYLTGKELDFEDPASYELDHVIPWSKGGLGALGNMQPCSPSANRMKNNHDLADFVALCRMVSDRHA